MLLPDTVAILIAKAENTTTNIMEIISTTPRRFRRDNFLLGLIFLPPKEKPSFEQLFNNFYCHTKYKK